MGRVEATAIAVSELKRNPSAVLRRGRATGRIVPRLAPTRTAERAHASANDTSSTDCDDERLQRRLFVAEPRPTVDPSFMAGNVTEAIEQRGA